MILDSETRPSSSRRSCDELRLWLRLLTCTTLIEGEGAQPAAREVRCTLPRFDLMASSTRCGRMTLSDVSKRMMVSNGMLPAGRAPGRIRPSRSAYIGFRPARAGHTLTKPARSGFRKMAAEHEIGRRHLCGSWPEGCPRLMRLWPRQGSAESAQHESCS